MSAKASPFVSIPLAPADPILGLSEAFQKDPNPNKVNLGVGVYQDNSGKVPVLNSVHEAERRILEENASKGYLPIDGLASYNTQVQSLLFGADAPLVADGCVVTVETPGGTGALRIGAEFLKRFFPHSEVWVSDPTWENHRAIFEGAGFAVNTYPYYDPETNGLRFDSMMHALGCLYPGTIVVLHACCHNPSGVDLTQARWDVLVDLVKNNHLIPFIDFAYQGFGQGVNEDSLAVRSFASEGVPCLVANSFSKNFSLYNERVGSLNFITGNKEESAQVLSQVKRVVRSIYSNPPAHGARIVTTILQDPALRSQWEDEVKEMRVRIKAMRALFVRKLKEKGVLQDFSFIEHQQGMFSFSGLPRDIVHRLRGEYGLYIVDSGRICLAAINDRNVDYVVTALSKVLP